MNTRGESVKQSLQGRLERAERRTEPPRPFKIVLHVVNVVPEGDPRCGTWEAEPEGQTTFPIVRFYGRNLAHLDELRAAYKAEQNPDLAFSVKPPRGPVYLTGEGTGSLYDMETVGELLTTATAQPHNAHLFHNHRGTK